MSKQNSSPPKGLWGGTGCLVGLVLLYGALLAGGVFLGLRLLAESDPTTTELPGLVDNTAPEQLISRRETAQAQLTGYGWVDQQAGLVRIPVEQAMAILAEEGLPAGPEPTQTPTAEPPTATPLPTATATATESNQPVTIDPAAATPTPTPEPSPTLAPAPTVDLAKVSFQNDVLPLFQQSCIQCHGGERPDGSGPRVEEGLKLLTYEDIMAGSWNGSVIEPGDVAGSYLIEQIATGRMPKDGERLSEAEVEIISAWVAAGAPNN
jgi:mono/diheme cytochrome c family protein